MAVLLLDRSDDARQAIVRATSHEFDPATEELIGAVRGTSVVGATLVRRQPGQTAVVWTPRSTAGEPEETAVALLAAAVATARLWHCSLVQALLENASDGELSALRGAGFEHAADLLLFVSWLHDAPADLAAPLLGLIPYRETDLSRLAGVIEETYEGTHDCPRLNGVRRLEDVIAGHRAVGSFDPANWFFVRQGGRDIGCLLLADHATAGQWELVYVGLVPAARGQGYGLQLMRSAQSLARQKGARQLLLAVDAANAPAIASYLATGFVVWDRKPVYLKILTPC